MSLNPNDILREAAAVFAEHDKHDRELQRLDPATLVRKRFEKFRSIGSVK
jgi:acetyl-CoA carboxylase alpha subunit